MNGKDIFKLRKRFNWSQEQLARELNVSVSTVHRWEIGKTTPSKLALVALERLRKRR